MLQIRQMQPEDVEAKAYVHWKSWLETYPGLVDAEYLSQLSVKEYLEIARRRCNHTLIAELDGKIVGFTSFGPCRDNDSPDCGEIYSIYLLKEAQGLGIGRKLIDAAFAHLSGFDTIVIWVLKGNIHASGFYKHYGFRFNGTEKEITIGTPNTELQLQYYRS